LGLALVGDAMAPTWRPHANARRLRAMQVGLPDLRIKKPISGRPEIGAQFQLWIFSYHIFGVLPK
jgi:hypothetical protein